MFKEVLNLIDVCVYVFVCVHMCVLVFVAVHATCGSQQRALCHWELRLQAFLGFLAYPVWAGIWTFILRVTQVFLMAELSLQPPPCFLRWYLSCRPGPYPSDSDTLVWLARDQPVSSAPYCDHSCGVQTLYVGAVGRTYQRSCLPSSAESLLSCAVLTGATEGLSCVLLTTCPTLSHMTILCWCRRRVALDLHGLLRLSLPCSVFKSLSSLNLNVLL